MLSKNSPAHPRMHLEPAPRKWPQQTNRREQLPYQRGHHLCRPRCRRCTQECACRPSSERNSFRTAGAATAAAAFVEIPPPTRPTRARMNILTRYPAVASSIASVFWKATDTPWQTTKVTTELFERQHELVHLDKHKERKDPEQSQDGPKRNPTWIAKLTQGSCIMSPVSLIAS